MVRTELFLAPWVRGIVQSSGIAFCKTGVLGQEEGERWGASSGVTVCRRWLCDELPGCEGRAGC